VALAHKLSIEPCPPLRIRDIAASDLHREAASKTPNVTPLAARHGVAEPQHSLLAKQVFASSAVSSPSCFLRSTCLIVFFSSRFEFAVVPPSLCQAPGALAVFVEDFRLSFISASHLEPWGFIRRRSSLKTVHPRNLKIQLPLRL
jgi:hypothetical protein